VIQTVRRLGAFVILTVLAGALASCGLFDRDPGERVLVVGDSVTYMSQKPLKEDLSWAGEVDVKAVSGLRTDELYPFAKKGVEADPSSAIFMPGYNDILKSYVAKADLPRMMDLAAEVPCVVWLLIPTKGVYSKTMAGAWNDRVRKEAEEHDNIHVVDDWANLVDNSPDYLLVKREDAVHPNEKGQVTLGRVMSDALRRECDG
jgi:hypothetical protein